MSTPPRSSRAEEPGGPLLQVRGIEVAYGRVQVLFEVDITVDAGGTTAIVGTNGAGKSTVLKAISGLLPISAGAIRFDGVPIDRIAVERRVDLGIVHVQGGAAVFGPLSVAENMQMAAYRLPRSARRRRIDGAMGRFPVLAERRRAPAAQLSGGQQQMLAMAMALVHEPRLLIIDELSMGLAPLVVGQLLESLAQLKADGLTILLVEQSLNVAVGLADRVVFMERGRVLFDGASDELARRDDLVRSIYLGGDR